MSKKTVLSIFTLILFVIMAVSSASTLNNTGSSYSNSESRSLDKFKGAEFPKTAQRCPHCFGSGCAKCNYKGVILR